MKKKLLIGTIVLFGIAMALFMNTLIAGALLVVWIYLVWMVRKKKISLFHDQMEPKLAERRYKRLKAFLLVDGIGFAMFWVSFILQVVLVVIFDLPEEEGPVVFFIAFFLLCCFL